MKRTARIKLGGTLLTIVLVWACSLIMPMAAGAAEVPALRQIGTFGTAVSLGETQTVNKIIDVETWNVDLINQQSDGTNSAHLHYTYQPAANGEMAAIFELTAATGISGSEHFNVDTRDWSDVWSILHNEQIMPGKTAAIYGGLSGSTPNINNYTAFQNFISSNSTTTVTYSYEVSYGYREGVLNAFIVNTTTNWTVHDLALRKVVAGEPSQGTPDGGGSQLPKSYTVTFNANGGKGGVASRKVAAGAAVGTLPVPTRANYTFMGWYSATSGGSKVSASTPVKANVTYWAQWQANNTLKSLKVSKGKLSPAFVATKAAYKVKLTKKQANTKLTFAKIAKAAKVQIKVGKAKWKTATKATIKVAKGKKVTVQIKVTVKGMKAKTYKVVVSRSK